jgi:hypothetical protein
MNHYEINGFSQKEDAKLVNVSVLLKVSDEVYEKKEYLIQFPSTTDKSDAIIKTKQRQIVVVSEVEEEVSSTEIVLEDGKYVQKTTTETVTKEVETPQWEDVPLYGEDGEQLMRLVSEAVEAVEGVDAVEAVEEELWADGDDLPEDVEIGDVKVEAVEGVEAVEAIDAQDAVYEGITHRYPKMEDYEEEAYVIHNPNNDFASIESKLLDAGIEVESKLESK